LSGWAGRLRDLRSCAHLLRTLDRVEVCDVWRARLTGLDDGALDFDALTDPHDRRHVRRRHRLRAACDLDLLYLSYRLLNLLTTTSTPGSLCGRLLRCTDRDRRKLLLDPLGPAAGDALYLVKVALELLEVDPELELGTADAGTLAALLLHRHAAVPRCEDLRLLCMERVFALRMALGFLAWVVLLLGGVTLLFGFETSPPSAGAGVLTTGAIAMLTSVVMFIGWGVLTALIEIWRGKI
jgi:hypothetical protein